MLARLAIFFIELYRKTTLNKPYACRYTPSCSAYTEEAVRIYGIIGIFVGMMRIIRCNQFFKGGYDPIQ